MILVQIEEAKTGASAKKEPKAELCEKKKPKDGAGANK